MTSSSELFDSVYKPNVSSTTLKRALQYVSLLQPNLGVSVLHLCVL